MRTSAMAALALALPFLAVGGTTGASAGGWCDRPAAAYYAPPYRAYRYTYAPVDTYYYRYDYRYRPRVIGYYSPPIAYYRAAPVALDSGYWGWRRRGFFGIGW